MNTLPINVLRKDCMSKKFSLELFGTCPLAFIGRQRIELGAHCKYSTLPGTFSRVERIQKLWEPSK